MVVISENFFQVTAIVYYSLVFISWLLAPPPTLHIFDSSDSTTLDILLCRVSHWSQQRGQIPKIILKMPGSLKHYEG